MGERSSLSPSIASTFERFCSVNWSPFPEHHRVRFATRTRPTGTIIIFISGLAFCAWLAGCSTTTPSTRVSSKFRLPVPAQTMETRSPDRLSAIENGVVYELTALHLITLTFDMHPDIKSSFHRFKSEEARYDFFYTSRDSLTPTLKVDSTIAEDRVGNEITETRKHGAELGVEKRFFDTTLMNVGVGYHTEWEETARGAQPYVSGQLRYPLWASRERLERTSEEIFRRNELNDAQLDYIQQVRSRVANSLYEYHSLCQDARKMDHLRSWLADLEQLSDRMRQSDGDGRKKDLERIGAEITRVAAEVGVQKGWFDVREARMKRTAGLPFNSQIVLAIEPFNPFVGASQQKLLQASLETDPEIATLRNAMENAQVQLDLARRGRWDITLNVRGRSNLEGQYDDNGLANWSATAGIAVSAVDSRVTDSLIRQAQANIERFQEAIAARENRIFVDTLEPLIRLDSIGASRNELLDNLPRYIEDYENGVDAYLGGELNVDDLIKRREDLYNRQQTINSQTYLLGANVTQLCTATGKFFELLDEHMARENGEIAKDTSG